MNSLAFFLFNFMKVFECFIPLWCDARSRLLSSLRFASRHTEKSDLENESVSVSNPGFIEVFR